MSKCKRNYFYFLLYTNKRNFIVKFKENIYGTFKIELN